MKRKVNDSMASRESTSAGDSGHFHGNSSTAMLADLSYIHRSGGTPDASWLANHYPNEPQAARDEALTKFQATLSLISPA